MINTFRSLSLAIRITFLVGVMVAIGMVTSMQLSFNTARDLMTSHSMEDMEYNCGKQAKLFSIYLDDFKDEVALLVDSSGLNGIAAALIAGDEERLEFWQKRVEKRFLSMPSEHYLQIRFIYFDGNGREVLRAERLEGGTELGLVPPARLQQKGHTAYVQGTKVLRPHEFYISPIDLNKENGEIVHPLQPTFRIAMPLFINSMEQEFAQNPVGMVVVNVDATFIFDVLSDIAIAQVILVNEAGYFLHYPEEPSLCWGGELGDPALVLAAVYPEFSQGHHNQDKGLATSGHGDIFFFQRITLSEKSGEYVTLLLHAQEKDLLEHIGVLQEKMLPIALCTLLVTVMAVYFIVQLVTGSIHRLTKKADLLSSGQTDISFRTKRNDEVGRLSMAFSNLVTALRLKNKEANEQRDEVQRLNQILQDKVDQLALSREDLLDQKQAFEMLYEKSADAVLLIEDGRFSECNESAVRMLRCDSKKTVLNLQPSELSPKYQPDGQLSQAKSDILLGQALIEGVLNFEWLHVDSKGVPFWVDIVLTALTFGRRDVLHVAWRNIDQRKQAEEELATTRDALVQQKQAYEMLFEKSKDTILLVDEGRIIDCNEATLKMMHCESKEVFLNTSPALLSPEYQPDGRLSMEKSAELMRIALKTGHHQFEWLHRRLDGELFWVDVVLSRVVWQGKTVLHGAVRDISMQKQLAIDLLKERDVAKKANQAKSEFLANMSHELRTPMHGILSYAHMGVKRWQKSSREKLQRYFKTIEASGASLMILLNDLLDVSKLDAGKMVYVMQDNDLNDWLQRVVEEYEPMAAEKNIQLRRMGANIPVMACFDGDKIVQVLRNVLENAIKFTPTGRHIRMWCHGVEEGGRSYIQVNIADGGVGIPPDELGAIFETFIQSSETRTGAGGTGLGLAISKRIIADHHGRIWAENNAEGGACFCFLLPVHAERASGGGA